MHLKGCLKVVEGVEVVEGEEEEVGVVDEEVVVVDGEEATGKSSKFARISLLRLVWSRTLPPNASKASSNFGVSGVGG